MTDSHSIISKVKQKRISDRLVEDKRLDGRGLLDYRDINVETDVITKAEGSALVSLGKTKVLVGVKIETGTPYSDTPNSGVLTVNVELVPLASPSFEPGPPNEDAIELARVVDRGIRESKALDVEKLCIIPGKKVLIVFVDVYVLDHDGNLFDASALASIAALSTTKMKKFKVNEEEVEFLEEIQPLPITNQPIEVTLGKIDNKILVDPSLDEEHALECQITIAIGKEGELCAIQKRGPSTFRKEEILHAFDIARDKAQNIRERYLVN
jgi:exosome complex component RRP42